MAGDDSSFPNRNPAGVRKACGCNSSKDCTREPLRSAVTMDSIGDPSAKFFQFLSTERK